jgi:hypothetical protein
MEPAAARRAAAFDVVPVTSACVLRMEWRTDEKTRTTVA